MKADASRRTFELARHYSAVVLEQGRMLTDSDLEEEHRILAHRIETGAADLVGGCGGPLGAAAFGLTAAGADLVLGAGRYYVDGILVENDADATYADQPDRWQPAWPPPEGAGRYALYLDVWRRLVTALDDPALREVALGGPTTSVRERTVWQVRALPATEDETCPSPVPDLGGTTGAMAAQADPEAADVEPCEVPPTAGFKGLENQFYRVEVHASGEAYDLAAAPGVATVTAFPPGTTDQAVLSSVAGLAVGDPVEVYRGAAPSPLPGWLAHVVAISGTTVTLDGDLEGFALADAPLLRAVDATFVWSRDNGSVVTSVERIDGVEVTVADLGPDDVLGFAPGQWVELADDRAEWEAVPGSLRRIQSLDVARRVVVLRTAPASLDPSAPDGVDPSLHPKLRRWDGAGAIRRNAPGAGGDWIHLESGVQVRFDAGRYRTGDWWHLPARTATADPASGTIVWPVDPSTGDPALRAPWGIEHHYCRVGFVVLSDADGDGTLEITGTEDCRPLFPPVTELTTLLYVGGDGQEGVPDPANPGSRQVDLPAPLQVRVANGAHPVAGARVHFTITAASNGRLQGANVKNATVATDADGVATCMWQLDGSTAGQVCEARLVDAADADVPHQLVRFHATLSTAARVAYDPRACPDLQAAGVRTVQQAIDALCRRGGSTCCCVPVGDGGEFPDIATALEALLGAGATTICLCLRPGRHTLDGLALRTERPLSLHLTGCGADSFLVVTRDIRVSGLVELSLDNLEVELVEAMGITAEECRDVAVTRCLVSGTPVEGSLLRVYGSAAVRVADTTMEALGPVDDRGEWPVVRDEIGLPLTASWQEWREKVRAVASEWVADDVRRRDLARAVAAFLTGLGFLPSLGESRAAVRLVDALLAPGPTAEGLFDHVTDLRRAVVRADPAYAIEFGGRLPDGFEPAQVGSHEGPFVLRDNDIAGIVSLYGGNGRPIRSNVLPKLEAALSRGSVQLDGHGPAVHVRDNRLARLAVGRRMAEAVEGLVGQRDAVLGGLHSFVHVTDNLVDGAENQVVGHQATLTSNDFALTAVRPSGDTAAVRALDVIADAAITTGNHGGRRGYRTLLNAQVALVARAEAQAADLELTFIV